MNVVPMDMNSIVNGSMHLETNIGLISQIDQVPIYFFVNKNVLTEIDWPYTFMSIFTWIGQPIFAEHCSQMQMGLSTGKHTFSELEGI